MVQRRRIVCLVAAGSGLLLLSAGLLAAPTLLAGALRGVLARSGVRAELAIESVGPDHVHIGGLRLGTSPDLELRSARLHFRPAALLRGDAGALEIDGLAVHVRRGPEGWSAGDLDPWLESDGADGGNADGDPGGGPAWLPSRIQLSDARLIVHAPEGELELRADGHATRSTRGIEELQLDARLAGARDQAAGELSLRVDPGGAIRASWRVSGRAPALRLLTGEAGPTAASVTAGGRVQGQVPALARLLEPDAAVAATRDARLRGMLEVSAAELRTAADSSPVELHARVHIGADAGSLTLSGEQLRIALGDMEFRPRIRARLGERDRALYLESLELALGRVRGGALDLEQATAELSGRLGGAHPELRLEGTARLLAPLRAELSTRARLSLRERAPILALPGCSQLRLEPPEPLSGSPIELCLSTPLDAPLSIGPELSGTLRVSPATLDLGLPEVGSLRGATPGLELSLAGTAAAPRLAARSSGGRLALAGLELEVDGLELDAGAELVGGRPQAGGVLTLTSLRHLADPPWWAPLRVTTRFDSDGNAQLVAGAVVGPADTPRIEFSAKRHPTAGAAIARAELRPLDLAALLPPRGLAPALAAHLDEISGSVAAEIQLEEGAPRVRSTAVVTLNALSAASAAYGRIEGLSGSIHLERIWPPRAAGPQTVRAALVDPGIPLRDISIRATPSGPDTHEVHVSGGGALGGALDLTLTHSPGTVQGQLEGRGLDLQQLVELLDIPDLEAEGRFDVLLPIALDAGGPRLRSGLLSAEPGSWLRYTPETTPAMLASAPSGTLETLRNFRCDRLEAVLDGDLQRVHTRLRLAGANPETPSAPPLDLNLDVGTEIVGDLVRILRGWRGDVPGS